MKIVDRATFLSMRAGTVYSKYTPCIFGDLCIKGETASRGIDFYSQSINDAIRHADSNEFFDELQAAETCGKSLVMDFEYEGRDGLLDEAQLFAVWEAADVLMLIKRLQDAIEGTATE